MSKRFIMIFSFFIILCFQGAYAEQGTENKFESVLNCFRVLYGKTYYNSNRYASGYFEKTNIVVLPHPLDSHTWLFVTADAIYQQLFSEKIDADFIPGVKRLWRTTGNHFELSLPNGQKLNLIFQYKQYLKDEPTKPFLAVGLVKNESYTCDLPSCTTLTPNDTTDTDIKEFVVDSLRNRIQTVYKRFSELNYSNRPADGFISALNTCKGIDEGLDSIIAQEIEKF